MFLFNFPNESIFGEARDTIKWAKSQRKVHFSLHYSEVLCSVFKPVSKTYDFRLQYLWFQAPKPMVLERKTTCFLKT